MKLTKLIIGLCMVLIMVGITTAVLPVPYQYLKMNNATTTGTTSIDFMNHTNATFTLTVTTNVSGYFNQGYYTLNDKATIRTMYSNIPFTMTTNISNFTTQCWTRLNSTGHLTAPKTYFSIWNGTDGIFLTSGGSSASNIELHYGSQYASALIPEAGKWILMTTVQTTTDVTNIKVYYNLTNIINQNVSYNNTITNLTYMGISVNYYTFNGTMDECKFYNYSLSETEINNTYYQPGEYPSSGLLNISFYNNATGITIPQNVSATVCTQTLGCFAQSTVNGWLYNITTYPTETVNVTVTFANYTTEFANYTVTNLSESRNESVMRRYLNVTMRDELTGALITSTVNLILQDSSNYLTASFTGGIYNFTLIPASTYSLRATSTEYGTKTLSAVTVPDGSLNLTMYLLNSTYLTVFTIRDANDNSIITGATMTISKYVNGTLTLLSVETSDITGSVYFYYNPTDIYYFNVTASGYQNFAFHFMISAPTYNVPMTPLGGSSTSTNEFTDVYVSITPTTFYANQSNIVNVTFSSPLGTFILYGYNITYPINTTQNSGVSATGATLTSNISIDASADIYDYVVITTYYTTNSNYTYVRSYRYPIVLTVGFGTWAYNKNNDFGLALFDRVVISTIVILILAGMTAYFMGGLPAGIMALMGYGYLAYSGFLPVWFIVIPVIVGAFILIGRGNQT